MPVVIVACCGIDARGEQFERQFLTYHPPRCWRWNSRPTLRMGSQCRSWYLARSAYCPFRVSTKCPPSGTASGSSWLPDQRQYLRGRQNLSCPRPARLHAYRGFGAQGRALVLYGSRGACRWLATGEAVDAGAQLFLEVWVEGLLLRRQTDLVFLEERTVASSEKHQSPVSQLIVVSKSTAGTTTSRKVMSCDQNRSEAFPFRAREPYKGRSSASP